ncbi:LytR/AlgR family response regulator transcription factor [Peribacillus sp. SCS-155]|uniref:LytR/AlgR family response regulator transcription factor n=1 Tax=Peribacillus sedimenti TaxID=3115297 RepID=UPI003905E10A
MRHLIGGLPDYRIVAEASDGEELIRSILTEKPDVALVDIGMPLLNGFEAIKSCINLHPTLGVIFITGTDDYAIEAFSVRAIDYILKPIERSRLYTALDRAVHTVQINNERARSSKKDLMVKQQNSINFVPFNDIIFIERFDRKTVIHTTNKQYETYDSLSSFEGSLDSRFLFSHRSYIINMDHLEKIENNGQSYMAFFKNYQRYAKISRNKIAELQQYKSF